MKELKILCFLLLALIAPFVPASADAQQIEITPLVGFGFVEIGDDGDHSHHHSRDGSYHHDSHGRDGFLDGIDIDDESSFGLLVGVGVSRHTQIEFLYNRLDTTLDDSRFDITNRNFDLEYLHVGAIYEWTFERVRPFAGGSLGTTRMSLPGDSENSFSLAPTGGLKVLINDRLALRFAARLFLTPFEENGPLGCPTNDCPDRGGEEALVDLQLSAGLTFRFGQARS